MSHVYRRCLVSGLVQGVYFRASAQEVAVAEGVSGYARNLPDGTVEVLAAGALDGVEALVEWLHSGPPAAKVLAVDCEALTAEAFTNGSWAEELRLGEFLSL